MRELMTRFREVVRDRSHGRKPGKQTPPAAEVKQAEPADWEMSSNDALRAPIVSGYK